MQKEFDLPVVCIGNLSAGGTGKTPMTEYLIRLLSPHYKLAVLSRGYKRKTKGFFDAADASGYESIGDEPYQYKTKFPDLVVVVDENRVRGIQKLKERYPDTEVVILDDAYQHRWVKPRFTILLTDYYKPYFQDFLLPMGYLREQRTGASRADVIVVTKSPKVLSPLDRRLIEGKVQLKPYQQLFFSYIRYGDLLPLFDSTPLYPFETQTLNTILMVTGIANSDPLKHQLKQFCIEVDVCRFADHHEYTSENIKLIAKKFDTLPTKKKIIVTTEKDAMRLYGHRISIEQLNLPIYYIPIDFCFHKNDVDLFESRLLESLK